MGKRLSALALLAMLVRAIVPAGYMLATADEGGSRYLTVRLCEAHNNAVRVLDLRAGRLLEPGETPKDQPKKQDRVDHAPCVFAAAAPLAPPVAQIEPVLFRTAYKPVLTAPRDVRPSLGIPAPPPPATGPPLSI